MKKKSRVGRRRKGEAPVMRHHKASGRAYVYYDRKPHYLGPWNSPEARRAYATWIKAWEAANVPRAEFKRGVVVTVGDLVAAHNEYADRHYRRRDGTKTDEVRAMRRCSRELVERHIDDDVEAIEGRDLRAIVEIWIAAGISRKSVNKMLGKLKRIFRWGAGRNLVTEATAARLWLVKGISAGEGGRETDEVAPVPLRTLARTLKAMPVDLAAMARVQYYCGCRPGEVCAMAPGEIVRGGSFRVEGRTVKIPPGLWVFLPGQHKTAKRGKLVYYTLGPRAQAVLAPWLAKAGAGYVFPGPKTEHVREDFYSRKCAEHSAALGGESWSPGRLRHNFLTRWDSLAGIELGSAAVRHSTLATTAIYVQRDLGRVGPVAAKIG